MEALLERSRIMESHGFMKDGGNANERRSFLSGAP